MDKAEIFDEYWQQTELDKFNVSKFAAQLSNYDSDDKELLLEFPEKPIELELPKTKLGKISARRKSTRKFTGPGLSKKEIGYVLAALHAVNGLEHRTYPSAGATYTTEVFCVAFRSDDKKINNKILYYDAEKHGVNIIGTAPEWEQASPKINVETIGKPQLLILLVSQTQRAVDKYGTRGSRFAILEAGAALQQLSLQIAQSKQLVCVAAGGLFDNYWLSELGLDDKKYKLAIGCLVGK